MATYTVLGCYDDVTPIPVGALPGHHAVEGDLDGFKHEPWAEVVQAESPDEAIRIALERQEL